VRSLDAVKTNKEFLKIHAATWHIYFKQGCHFLSDGTLNFFFTGTNNTSFFKKKITAQALSFIKREKLHPKE
jgi:hypothetical protein